MDGGDEGSPYGRETAGLMKITAGSTEAELILSFTGNQIPRDLSINGTGDTLYFINGSVYRYAISGTTHPELLVESPYGKDMFSGFYGLDIDPISSEIYVADAIDFVQRGMVYRFSPEGMPVDTFRAGIAATFTCDPESQTTGRACHRWEKHDGQKAVCREPELRRERFRPGTDVLAARYG